MDDYGKIPKQDLAELSLEQKGFTDNRYATLCVAKSLLQDADSAMARNNRMLTEILIGAAYAAFDVVYDDQIDAAD